MRSSLHFSTVDRFVPADLFGVVIEERAGVRIGGRSPGETQRDLRQRAVGRALGGADRRPVIEGSFIGVGADVVAPLGNNFGPELGRWIRALPTGGEGFVAGGTAAGAGNRARTPAGRHRRIGLPTVADDPGRPECVAPKLARIKLVKARKWLRAAG